MAGDPGTLRVRAGIRLPVWASRRPPGQARGARIPGVCKRRATPPGGMHRRPHWQPYSRASPKCPVVDRFLSPVGDGEAGLTAAQHWMAPRRTPPAPQAARRSWRRAPCSIRPPMGVRTYYKLQPGGSVIFAGPSGFRTRKCSLPCTGRKNGVPIRQPFYSGPGSDAANLPNTSRSLRIVKTHGIEDVDLGCGDFRVGSQLAGITRMTYVGVDVVDE